MDRDLKERIARKKRALDSLRPLPKAALERLRHQFAIELAYNSNAIEGNTLTLMETRLVIEEGMTVRGKSLREHFEAANHQKAFGFLEKAAKGRVTEEIVKELHRLIMAGIDDRYAGKYRDVNVSITGAPKRPPGFQKVPGMMKELFSYVSENPDRLGPVEMAAFLHYRLVEIHSFIDGNGRAARLAMNLYLMGHGYPVTLVLNADRKRYYDRLRKADLGDMEPFVNFIGRCVERSLDLYLEAFGKSPKHIPLAEAAEGTPFSQEYLSLLARKGRLEAVKIGRNWFTTKEAVRRYMESRKR